MNSFWQGLVSVSILLMVLGMARMGELVEREQEALDSRLELLESRSRLAEEELVRLRAEHEAFSLEDARHAQRQEALREVLKVIGRSSGTRSRLPNNLRLWVHTGTGVKVPIDEVQ